MLPRRHLVVRRLDLEAHLLQVGDDQPPRLLAPVHRADVEVAGDVVHLGRRAAARVLVEEEELRLDARHHLEAQLLRARHLPLQRQPRAPRELGVVGVVDVADDAGDHPLLRAPRKDAEGAEVRGEEHVGLLDPHEALDRGAVEHDLPVQRLLELTARHLDVLHHAQNVGELEPEEPDVEPVADVEDVALGGAPRLQHRAVLRIQAHRQRSHHGARRNGRDHRRARFSRLGAANSART